MIWRLAVKSDLPRIHELWAEMDRKFGRQDRPDLFAMPVLLTLVAEDENGVVVSALYGECVVDWTMIGANREAGRMVDKLFPYLEHFLLERTIRVARVLVPKRIERHMQKLLPQMRNISESFAQFVYVLRK